jgi:hypothetical protein
MQTKLLSENLTERDQSRDLDEDEKIILRFILECGVGLNDYG